MNAWTVIQVGKEYTFKNKKTGSRFGKNFLWCGKINEDYSAVQLSENEWTYFDAKNGKLLDETFSWCSDISNGFGAVTRKNGDATFFNAKLGIVENFKTMFLNFCETKSLAKVQLEDETYAIFNVETRKFFESRFEKSFFTLIDIVKQHPIDFLSFPTEVFKDQVMVKICVDAIKRTIKNNAEQKGHKCFGFYKKLKKYENETMRLIENKIEQENENLAKEKTLKQTPAKNIV